MRVITIDEDEESKYNNVSSCGLQGNEEKAN